MNALEKRRKKLMRKNHVKVVGNDDYEFAKAWGEYKAGKLLYDYHDTKKRYNLNALEESIKKTYAYGHNENLTHTKNGVELTNNTRKFFRIASKSMSRTKRQYDNYGVLPSFVDLMGKYYEKHPNDVPTSINNESWRTLRKKHKKNKTK